MSQIGHLLKIQSIHFNREVKKGHVQSMYIVMNPLSINTLLAHCQRAGFPNPVTRVSDVVRGRLYQTIRMPNSSYCCLSQKRSHGDISGTKRGIIDPLVSKRPEKILNKKLQDFFLTKKELIYVNSCGNRNGFTKSLAPEFCLGSSRVFHPSGRTLRRSSISIYPPLQCLSSVLNKWDSFYQ